MANFDEEPRGDALRETDLFFEAILREDRSILDFLDVDFSFVNERLAKYYGIEGVKGKEFRRVKLPPNRGGILTHASILTPGLSNPTRTSARKAGGSGCSTRSSNTLSAASSARRASSFPRTSS